MVDLSHLKLILKIGAGSKTLYDYIGTFAFGIVRQKLTGTIHFHIGNMGCDSLNQIYTLSLGEHLALLSSVDHNANDQLIKDFCSTLNNVQMADGNRIKAAGVNSYFQYNSPC